MKDLSNEYIAGLFDGEGCLVVYDRGKKGHANRAHICATFLPILQKIQKQFGGYIYKLPTPKQNKNTYQWVISAKKDIKPFVETIYMYLQEKKEQAAIMISYLNGDLSIAAADKTLRSLKRVTFNFN